MYFYISCCIPQKKVFLYWVISVVRLWIPSAPLCCPASWHFHRDVDSPLLWLCYYLCGLVRDGTKLSPIPTLQLSYGWRGGILVQYCHLEEAVWKGLMTPVTQQAGKGQEVRYLQRAKMTYRVGMCSYLTLCIEELFCGKKNEDYFGDVIKKKKR